VARERRGNGEYPKLNTQRPMAGERHETAAAADTSGAPAAVAWACFWHKARSCPRNSAAGMPPPNGHLAER
jgi:hypothetical protein